MGAVDFGEWAAPGLELAFGGRTYMVPPPSVSDAATILALAVRGEINLGLVEGPMPPAMQAVLDATQPKIRRKTLASLAAGALGLVVLLGTVAGLLGGPIAATAVTVVAVAAGVLARRRLLTAARRRFAEPATGHPALGEVHEQLARDGVPQTTIDRMGYYAVFYWARGREYADTLARLLWESHTPAGEDGEGDPKDS